MSKFEIYETGDPHSRAWDCTEVTERGDFYRGDISGIHTKAGLVRWLRRMYPECVIVNRDSGRRIMS